MRVTRRFWATVGLAVFLTIGAVVLEQPLLLVGTAGIGAFVLAQQIAFMLTVRQLADDLTVDQSASPTTVPAGSDVEVVLEAYRPSPTTVEFSVGTTPPLAAADSGGERVTQFAVGDESASQSFRLRWPVAGKYEFNQATVRARDRAGLFETSFTKGSTPTITVNPRQPRDVHIGLGGERVESLFGPQQTTDRGSGFDPAEIREYVPGDPARQIDWKATARMDSPHIRTFEADTDLTTTLLVDHRSSMATGDHGEQKLDYARQVAIGFIANAQQADSPCGITAIDNGGLTVHLPPEARKEYYERLRGVLHTMDTGDDATTESQAPERKTSQTVSAPGQIQRRASRLQNETSAFATSLRPFFDSTTHYVHRINEEPLYNTVRTHPPQDSASNIAVILTDDSHRVELRETVKLARQQYTQVLVFMTPTVLFEQGTLADLSTAYTQYLDFESFRRDLMQTRDVVAFEVGPRDRLNAILNSQNRTQTSRRANS